MMPVLWFVLGIALGVFLATWLGRKIRGRTPRVDINCFGALIVVFKNGKKVYEGPLDDADPEIIARVSRNRKNPPGGYNED